MKIMDVDIVCADSRQRLSEIKKDVQELYLRVFEKPLNDKAWNHFYLNCPYGHATSFVFYLAGRLIAHGGVIPQVLVSSDGKAIKYYLQTAIMVDKDYRNLHIFKKLMDSTHAYVREKAQFVIAFPNDNTYMPFVKMLLWRKVNEYNIRQYEVMGENTASEDVSPLGKRTEYKYSLKDDSEFFKWRSELNQAKFYKHKESTVVYKDYEGALEVLDVNGNNINFMDLAVSQGYSRMNIAECFFVYGSLDGLKFVRNVGIPQRLCVYPAEFREIDYEKIKPSLLLSDVF